MSRLPPIVVPIDTRQLEKAIKLTKELISLEKQRQAVMGQVSISKGRTLDKSNGRTL